MKLFNRNNNVADSIPEDLKPYYQGQGSSWRRWVGPVLRGVMLLALLALLVWGGIWGVNKLINRNDNSGKSTASTTAAQKDAEAKKAEQQAAAAKAEKAKEEQAKKDAAKKEQAAKDKAAKEQAAKEQAQKDAAKKDASKTQAASGSTPPAATSPTPTAVAPTPATSQDAASGTLANTGPGEMIAVFFATVVFATFGYYFVSAYQASASRRS